MGYHVGKFNINPILLLNSCPKLVLPEIILILIYKPIILHCACSYKVSNVVEHCCKSKWTFYANNNN